MKNISMHYQILLTVNSWKLGENFFSAVISGILNCTHFEKSQDTRVDASYFKTGGNGNEGDSNVFPLQFFNNFSGVIV